MALAVAFLPTAARADGECVSDIRNAAQNGSFCHNTKSVASPAQAPSPAASAGMGKGLSALAGALLAPAVTTQTNYPAAQHASPTPVVSGDDGLGRTAGVASGVGAADDIISGYIDDGTVKLTGTTPLLLNSEDADFDVSESPEESATIAGFPAASDDPAQGTSPVTSLSLSDMATAASDEFKGLITKAADLEQRIGESNVVVGTLSDVRTAAGAANDMINLMNGGLSEAEQVPAAASANNALVGVNALTVGIRGMNACQNGLTEACSGASTGAAVSLVTNGIPGVSQGVPVVGTYLTLGAAAGSSGIASVNQGLNAQRSACESLSPGACAGFETLPSQQNLNQYSTGFFNALR
jgi:hypothetical protein